MMAPEVHFVHETGVNAKTREIFVSEKIDEEFGGWFVTVLRYLISLDNVAPVTVWLNTQGGDVMSMFTFHDAVRSSPVCIRIIGHGEVCSAGVLMLACGHERLVTESCVLMSHEGESAIVGRFSEIRERIKLEEWMQAQWATLMARYTPKEAKYWRRLTEKKAEYWVLGGQAIVDDGIADRVLTPQDVI